MNTICISKSWLRKKSLELGIKDSAIETIVHEYINQLGNDSFPTDDYIKQLFIPKSLIVDDKDYYDNLMKIYNSIGGETIYNTEEEAIVAYNKALKVFDESSVTLTPTNEDKYIVRIAKPINKNYEKELLSILTKAPRDNQGRLLAPNGKPSNLTEKQYAQVRTKAFKDWFGDWENDPSNASKVVDENGEPLVVYHGGSNTKIFDTSGNRRRGAGIKKGIKGTYFTTSKENAKYYEEIYNFKTSEKWISYADELREQGASEEEIKALNEEFENERPITRAFFLNIKNPIETYYYGNSKDGYNEKSNTLNKSDGQHIKIEDKKYEEYIAIRSNQIKSATDNSGAFSSDNDDIYDSQILQQLSLTRFSISESNSYPIRTKENADWSDITLDFTESDKGSGGRNELTKRVAGKKYIHFKLHSEGDNSYDANEILEAIKQAGLPTKNIKLNIAGSEIGKLKETQERYNEEIERILNNLLDLGITISEIRTGGLTGIDEAGIIAALRLGIPNEVHTTSDYKFRDKLGKDISDEQAFKARFLQLSLTQQPQGEKVSDKNTYKGKKKDEESKIEFANDTLKETYDNFVEKQRELGTIIKFNPKNHSYIIDGVKNDFSVTEYRDFIRTGKRKSGNTNFYLEVSSRLGATHDEMLRDFFSEKGLLDSYTNMNSTQIKKFKKEAQKLKENLQNEFGEDAVFITDEDLLRVAATMNINGNNYLVAGTMDMIVIDNKGNIHIVDFKTKRANSSKDLDEGKLTGYNQQINLYKALLEQKLGSKVSSVRIALFNIRYTNQQNDEYTYKGNQIYYKKRPILFAKDSNGNYIYNAGVFYDAIEFEEDLSEDLYDKIMPIETRLQELKKIKEFAASNSADLTEDDFSLFDDAIDELLKTTEEKGNKKEVLSKKADKTKSEILELKDAIVTLTKEIKTLKEGKSTKEKNNKEKYKVLDESIEEKKEAKKKEIQEKLKYKRIELQQIQQKLNEFIDDFYHLELLEEKGDYTALYILSMDKFLTGVISEEGVISDTIITNDKKLKKLKELTLCMPLSSLLTLDTTYVNYNLLYTLDELLRNKFLFPIGPSEKVELSEDLKPIAESMKKQNKNFPYDSKTGILQIPKFTVGYSYNEIIKRNQRNNLLNNDLISQSQLRHLAKATIYKVSEIITKIHDNLNGYTYFFGNNEGDPNVNKDFTLMSRIEIILTIGLKRLFDLVKKGREAVFDLDNFDENLPFELMDIIDLITDNWEAFIDLGYDTLINLEEIALDNNTSTADLKSDINTLFEDNDESVIQELFGSSIEHWQVGFRQVSAINSMSKLLKIVLDSFYQVDENGDIIIDDLGIGVGKHLNALEAAAKILYYTLGARSIDDMIKLLKALIDVEPWLSLLMPYIENQYDREGNLISIADETFRSLFYSNFKKYFQKYAITFKKGNKILTKVINESSYTESLMDISIALENSATLGKFNLKTKENKLNEEALVKLKELSKIIDNFANTANNVRGAIEDNTNFNLNKFHDTLHLIYNLLNIETPNDKTFYKIFSIKTNINTLNKKLKYLISKGIEENKDKINDGSKTITSIKDYKDIADIVGKYMGLEMESVTYEAGKMYYSYVLPSYLGRLISKLKGENLSEEEYEKTLKDEYLQYPLFRTNDGKIRCHWLERLKASKKVREMFQHIVSLHYLGVEYTNKTPVEYITSMMRAYFYDDNAEWAYYRVPTLSNKPSEEYIRFSRVKDGYEDFVINHLVDTFTYELDRIQAVRTRRDSISEDKKIKNFDTFVLKDKDGNIIKIKKGNGEKFVFLDWILPYLDKSFKNTKEYKLAKKQAERGDKKAQELLDKMQLFSDFINKKLDNKMSNETADTATLFTLFKDIAKVSLESKYQEARQYWEREGFLTRKPVEKDGKKTETIEIFGFGKGNNKELTLENLREFFFNDMFASINILQLTIGDTAYYKDTEDLQKRLAQIHAPGMLANTLATYVLDGLTYRYSDGFERTIYISDDIIKSELIPNLKIATENILNEYDKKSKQYAILKKLFDFILSTAKEINVADAQGFSCLTSHRKKLALFGLWTDRMEEAYLLLTDPEYAGEDASLNDILDVLLLPIKPFVYTLIPKNGYNNNLSKLKVGVLNKNSEYVIALVGAILKRGNLPNKLRAIYLFMEDSQKNGKGIDTILFESTVKAGLTGVINLNGNMSEEDIYNVLLNHLYDNEGNYNIDYVHEIPFEDYIIQQNVPSHFRDHALAHGSQNRILAIADLLDTDENGDNNYITIDGKTITVKEAKENYFNAIADNIKLSVEEVIKRFNIDSVDKRQRNIALSRILKDTILKDSRFGADLYWACDTNEYGEFNIPLSDPIHSTRILQLLNSIIKNAINKQEIAGGPVVLATSWGLSDELHIRFKSYDDKILLTEEEFETENYPTDYDTGNYLPKGDYTSYEDYVKDNQDCVAYFECCVPILDKNIALDFTRRDDDGNEYIDIEAMKEANPKLLEMISYRIPTESKYSMVPIKVKGFINNMSGELIMMPKEITWLSGSDFDKFQC